MMTTINDEVLAPALQAPVTKTWDRRSTGLLVCVLVIAAVVILRGVKVGEFSYNVDETQHAVTGLFVADLVRDHPLLHPVEYTYRYYAQYPALGGVIHWPPLFYCLEGMSFILLGSTVVTARLAVVLSALLMLGFWFRLVRGLLNEWAAAFSTLCLAFAPSILIFEKTVMLEVPLLACTIAASFFWIEYLLRDRKSDVYWFSLFASAALLTKQNAVYLVLFCLLSGLLCGGWRIFLRVEVLRAVAICAVLALPYYIIAYVVHWGSISKDLNDSSAAGGMYWLYYWSALPAQLGWGFLTLALLGILTSMSWGRPKANWIMLSWILSCYLVFTLIDHKAPRYILCWLPPFFYFIGGLLLCFFRKPWLKVGGAVAAVAISLAGLASAWSYHRPNVEGYAAVATKILEVSKSGIILFDGPLPGNFIFYMRADDPARRFLVLRKALYSETIYKRRGGVELVHSQQEVEDLLREDGVRFIVASDNYPLEFNSQKLLRDVLKTPGYKELGRFLITGDGLTPANSSLVLYENLNWAPPEAKYLRIKMLTTGRDIVVPFDAFIDPRAK